jgi:hypothetical protein
MRGAQLRTPQTNKYTSTQANKQTGKQSKRQTGKQANKQTSKQANKRTNKQTNKQTSRQESQPEAGLPCCYGVVAVHLTSLASVSSVCSFMDSMSAA